MRRSLPLLLSLFAMTAAAEKATAPEDPNLWLEGVSDAKALDWVRAQNADSTKELAQSDAFRALEKRLLSILDSDEKIPGVAKRGEHYYNFWRDAKHERGLWRRTSLAEYRKDKPAWETVLDLDALGRSENENWVWHGADCLAPAYRRCLVKLSRGGADADVVREFDVVDKAFVKDGFALPEAKSSVSWRDADSLYVGTDFGAGSMTESGYPRVVKLWQRGTPLADARTVYEAKAEDIGSWGYRDHTPGFERDFYGRALTFYTNELFVVRDGKPVKIDKQDSANANVWREWLLIDLRDDWQAGGKSYKSGSLLAANFNDFLAGERRFDVLFEPGQRTSLAGFDATRHHLILSTMDNVKARLFVLTPGEGGWKREPLAGAPAFGDVTASAVDGDESDDFFLTVTDFTTPTSLYLGAIEKTALEKLKDTPAFYDASGVTVDQYEAVSKDGTGVPYFIVMPKDLKRDGKAPTLLYGYGGFEVSMQPFYSGTFGSAWLEKGGVFVLANIRGGGEFGPKWHQAALKANRHRAYEDFAAVAQDLVKRKITSPAHLGAMGGSNGGLLTGNMLVSYGDLFGAIVCQVPLLDMRRYHLLLAGASWMGEYGNPDDAKEWEFIREFSPYHLVRKDKQYPRTLFTTSTRDDRVHPGHARKMVARMKEQGHDVLYYENIEGGHGGAANNKQSAFMSALAFTFLWQELGPK